MHDFFLHNHQLYRALDDIKNSIEELQFYKETVFKSQNQYTTDMEGSSDQGKKIAILIFAFVMALLAMWLSGYRN